MPTVEIRRWKEKRVRDNGEEYWSDTDYEGLYINHNGFEMLLANLSHGLRPISLAGKQSHFQFEVVPGHVKVVTEAFFRSLLELVTSFMIADRNLQILLPSYLQLVRRSQQ